ncbi:MAG: hypothetical protein CMJ06_00125 [Pelagibacterales bacterium]|mgnify:CR=1 FL=1|nr:hypothetical protein [Pelagibacterales bacterium]|tara:strand:+ start:2164 stop:3063 length:900 start_codon:yes stop_codon:yes gene_type:complete
MLRKPIIIKDERNIKELKTKNNIKLSLKKHLNNFGLKFFNSYDNYFKWQIQCLDNINLSDNEKNKYFNFLNKNKLNKNYKLPTSFYDLIASNRRLSVITHSMKSNDILYNGVSIINDLNDCKNILDIGCNLGYLTSFYSKVFKNSNIIGLDKSKKSILLASEVFHKKKYNNLCFTYDYNFLKDINFDYICDTQCLFSLNKKNLFNLLDIFKLQLVDNGKIISISNIPGHLSAKYYLQLFKKKDFFIDSISPIFVKNIYGIQAFTKIIFTRENKKKKYNLKNYYTNLRKKISMVNLHNLL